MENVPKILPILCLVIKSREINEIMRAIIVHNKLVIFERKALLTLLNKKLIDSIKAHSGEVLPEENFPGLNEKKSPWAIFFA